MPTRRDLLLAVFLLATFRSAQGGDGATRRDELFARLRQSTTEHEGRLAEDAVWRMWMEMAPSRKIAAAVSEAMRARESYDFDKALTILDGVVIQAPQYAEGWNQRAFVRFLKEDHDGALQDIDRALQLEPKHFAALAGKAMILMRQGRVEVGQAALRQAVDIHPWLRERSMLLSPVEPPSDKGRDI